MILAWLKDLIAVLTNPAALLLIALAYTSGYFRGESRADAACNAAALQAEIAALKKDRDAALAAAKRFEAEAAANASQAEKNAQIVREISNAPKNGRCRMSDSDARRVFSIR